MYKHSDVHYGPFLRARSSSLQLPSSDASGGTFFFLLSSRRFLCSFLSFFGLGKPCAWEEAEKFWFRHAWCRLCVLTPVGSCVPNYQAKTDKTTFTGRCCSCLKPSSWLFFVVYTKMHWINCLYEDILLKCVRFFSLHRVDQRSNLCFLRRCSSASSSHKY